MTQSQSPRDLTYLIRQLRNRARERETIGASVAVDGSAARYENALVKEMRALDRVARWLLKNNPYGGAIAPASIHSLCRAVCRDE